MCSFGCACTVCVLDRKTEKATNTNMRPPEQSGEGTGKKKKSNPNRTFLSNHPLVFQIFPYTKKTTFLRNGQWRGQH